LIKEQVIELLRRSPEGLTGAKIAEKIGITQGAMSKYLSMMRVDGAITSRKIGVAKLWKLLIDSDKAQMLADRIGEHAKATFKDYALSLAEGNGKLYEADGKRVLVMPINVLSGLYKYTESIIGSQVHTFFYEWGRDYVEEVSGFVEDVARKSEADFFQSFLLLWKLKGWGRFEVIAIEKDSIEVVWYDSIMSEVRADVPVDDFISGALGAIAAHVIPGNWRFEEVECVVTGAPRCRFRGNLVVQDLQ
jgi:predicted hydrocarbon binding protein